MAKFFDDLYWYLCDRAYNWYGVEFGLSVPEWVVWIPYPFRHFIMTITSLSSYDGIKLFGMLALLITFAEMISVTGFLIKLVKTLVTYHKNKSWFKEEKHGRKRTQR